MRSPISVALVPPSLCVVDGTDCSNGVCYHQLQNNTAYSRCQPPVPQFNSESVTITVTTRNIVGRSNPAVLKSVGDFFYHCWDL